MTQLQLIYDPTRELATFVDLDTGSGWGPAMVGLEAEQVLQGFVDAMPFDVAELGSDGAHAAFMSFLSRLAESPPETTYAAPERPVEPAGDDPELEAARADREAQNASDVPAPAPADTDVAADSGPPVEVAVQCWSCGGSGQITFGDDTPPQTCNLCHGTGRVMQPAAT